MTGKSQERLGIIAGGGQLPALLIEFCRAERRPYTVIAIEGEAEAGPLGESPALWMRLGEAAKGFDRLRSDSVQAVVMAGKVRRPTFKELLPDWRTAKFLARVGIRAFINRDSVGDDSLLRTIIGEIEMEGFTVIGVDAVLANLLVEKAVLGAYSPTDDDTKAILVGLRAAKDLGHKDVGQAVVVQNGAVLAREGVAGTDGLIAQAGELKLDGQGPVLVKVSKPGQDRRADLPAIGPDTVAACSAAGFRGIAIEAGATLVIDRVAVTSAADQAGLFVAAVDGAVALS
jgi:DUF1009 family protein